MFAPVVMRFHSYQVPLTDSSTAYLERMLDHPALIEWVAAGRAEATVIEQEER